MTMAGGAVLPIFHASLGVNNQSTEDQIRQHVPLADMHTAIAIITITAREAGWTNGRALEGFTSIGFDSWS
jgi:hypothetical protein